MQAPVVTEDFFSATGLEDPYPLYDRLRAAGPVHRLAEQDLHLVLGQREVRQVLDDPGTFSSNLAGVLQHQDGDVGFIDTAAAGAVDVLATADPPVHTAQRRVLQKPFSRARIHALTDEVDALLTPRIAQLVGDGGGDWMAGVATPLPVLMIGRVLGLPARDADRLTTWSDAAIELLSGLAPADRLADVGGRLAEFMDYLRGHLDDARRQPSGGLLDDIAATAGAGQLTEREAVVVLVQLVTAGTESTTSLIGSAARLLATDPALQDRLREAPALIDSFVEETLRLESPFRGHFRITTRPTELGGVSLPRGAKLMLLWGAANRDADPFPDPASLDLERPGLKSHTGFGRGIHFCLGAHLARLEATRAITGLLAVTDRVDLVPGSAPRHLPSMFVRRLARLPLAVTPSATRPQAPPES